MLLTILGFLFGIVLSVRFDVLVLVPAILLGWLLAVIGGLAGGGTIMSIILGMVWVATALQIGYMAGIVGQWALRSSRAVPQSRNEKPAVAPDGAF